MEKTCYERFVELVLANSPVLNSNELVDRGYSQAEIKAFYNYASFVKVLLSNYGGTLEEKLQFMRHYAKWCRFGFQHNWEALKKWAGVIGYPEEKFSRDQFPMQMPMWRFFDDEIEIIKKAELMGRGERVILEYEDQYEEKTSCCYPYKRIPFQECGRKDIFVVCSRHPESGLKAVEAIYHYAVQYGQLPEGIIFLGLNYHENLAEYKSDYAFRKDSAYRMFLRQAIALGLPKDWLKKFLIKPHDDEIKDIDLLIETLNTYHQNNVNLIFVSCPSYQMRVMSEYPLGLDDGPSCYVRIADIPPKREDGPMREQRILSFDKPEFQLLDLALVNCVGKLFIDRGKARLALPDYDEYPEEFKPLAPLGLKYADPSIVCELCGTDEKVAKVLKIMRALMLDAHDEGMCGQFQDIQQAFIVSNTANFLWERGFTNPVLMKQTRLMSEEQFLEVVC